MRVFVAVLVLSALAGPAAGQDKVADEDPVDRAAARRDAADNPGFGPLVTIERIEVVGNSSTAERLIRRALLVKEGDELRAGDPRFRTSRFRVLALGYFADVQLELRKGSTRGSVILTVEVAERGTLTLSRLFFGSSEATPVWLGVDAGDTNFAGTGVGVGAAVVWASQANITGAESQLALRLRYFDPSLLGLPLGTHATLLYNDASEPYRVMGDPGDGAPANFAAFGYSRVGGSAGVGLELTRQLSLVFDGRLEVVDRDDVPAAAGDVALGAGRSVLATAAAGVARDSRSDPVLTNGGDLALFGAEASIPGTDYEFLKLQARYSRWVPLGGVRHVLSVHLGAGILLGDAPAFDRFYLGDWNKLLPPRPLDLVVSTASSPDFLGVSEATPRAGEAAASAEIQYSYRLFRRSGLVYGGDLFVGVGVMALGSRRAVLGDPSGGGLLDLTFDVGLRVDTEIGVFELALANAFGRMPL